MRRGMKKTRRLKVRHHAARLIDLNEYFDSFTEATSSDKIDVTKLNDIILNRIPNICSKQSHVQGFDY